MALGNSCHARIRNRKKNLGVLFLHRFAFFQTSALRREAAEAALNERQTLRLKFSRVEESMSEERPLTSENLEGLEPVMHLCAQTPG